MNQWFAKKHTKKKKYFLDMHLPKRKKHNLWKSLPDKKFLSQESGISTDAAIFYAPPREMDPRGVAFCGWRHGHMVN
jgi:hypothetical protein